MKVDVLIVGAGPAGLTAAWQLTGKSSLSVCVLEADPTYVGGISRTESHKGFLFDIGGHRFFSKSAEIEAMWSEMLPGDMIDRPRKSRIFYGGKFYSYPLKAFEALRNLGVLESALCVLSYARARVFPQRVTRSFHQWVANQFGERLFRIFFKTYTEKVWGMSCDDLSADWAAQRIKGLSLASAIGAALGNSLRGLGLRRARGTRVIKTLIESFRYPRRGPGMLWENVASTVVARGATLLKGCRAQRFEWDAGSARWTVRALRHDGSEVLIDAAHVISSAPMREVVAAVTPAPRTRERAARLAYRDFLTVALILRDSGDLFDDNWIYIHDSKVKVGRIQNFSSWSPDMVPRAGSACLGLEYFCFEGDGLWNTADRDLVELAATELAQLGLARREQIEEGYVVRQAKAYPVYDDQYRAIVDEVRAEFATRFPTMHFVGRNGMHKYNNQDHAMMTAILSVENILAGQQRFDVWAVNEDAEYHEHASADEAAALGSVRLVPTRLND
ncbi:MAG: NAD(P)/FAD-dependent oxidoreductase [Burkholderiaceae bacterium]|nr:NAD(P)/FAD-dependent oxidoreductase [Burkholderiaceae bacterium]